MLCPGVGFDVIPTDCVAAALKEALPDATHLALGFDSKQGFHRVLQNKQRMGEGGKIRKDGKITTVPLAHYVRTIDFGDGKKCYERSVGRCIYSVLYNGYSKH